MCETCPQHFRERKNTTGFPEITSGTGTRERAQNKLFPQTLVSRRSNIPFFPCYDTVCLEICCCSSCNLLLTQLYVSDYLSHMCDIENFFCPMVLLSTKIGEMSSDLGFIFIVYPGVVHLDRSFRIGIHYNPETPLNRLHVVVVVSVASPVLLGSSEELLPI